MEPLVVFHQLLVTPRVRRLREHHFCLVSAVPSPILRLFLLKVAYACPPQPLRDGWIDYFGSCMLNRLAARKDGLRDEAEMMYARFQCSLLGSGGLEG